MKLRKARLFKVQNPMGMSYQDMLRYDFCFTNNKYKDIVMYPTFANSRIKPTIGRWQSFNCELKPLPGFFSVEELTKNADNWISFMNKGYVTLSAVLKATSFFNIQNQNGDGK